MSNRFVCSTVAEEQLSPQHFMQWLLLAKLLLKRLNYGS